YIERNPSTEIFFTDEAWFHLSGYVNSQNCRFWSADKPRKVVESPLHPQKVGVWCAISHRRIIGPIFFEKTVNTEVYLDILRQFLGKIRFKPESMMVHQPIEVVTPASSSVKISAKISLP
ncbi:uncharacterized protein B4U80_09266, partial [Leptotrombidium deliense]